MFIEGGVAETVWRDCVTVVVSAFLEEFRRHSGEAADTVQRDCDSCCVNARVRKLLRQSGKTVEAVMVLVCQGRLFRRCSRCVPGPSQVCSTFSLSMGSPTVVGKTVGDGPGKGKGWSLQATKPSCLGTHLCPDLMLWAVKGQPDLAQEGPAGA
eukprot:1158498-Pelagomonas_calceolata.AAC.2